MLLGDYRGGVDYFRRAQTLIAAIPFGTFPAAANETWRAIAAVLDDDLDTAVKMSRNILQRILDRRMNAAVVGGLRIAALALARSGDAETAATLLGAADATGNGGRFMQRVIDRATQLVSEALGEGAQTFAEQGRSLAPVTAATRALEALDAVLAQRSQAS